MPSDDALTDLFVGARLPGAHLGLRWAEAGESDVADVLDLVRRVDRAEHPARVLSDQEIAWLTTGEGATTVLGRDAAGEVRGFASVTVSGCPGEFHGTGLVSPQWCGMGIGRALLGWQVATVTRLRGRDAGPGSFVALLDDAHLGRRRLHAAAGFTSRHSTMLMSGDLGDLTHDPVPEEWRIESLAALGPRLQETFRGLRRARRGYLVSSDSAWLRVGSSGWLLGGADPETSLVLFEGESIVGLVVNGHPAPAPHLAPDGADPATWTQGETRLLAAADEAVATDLVVLTRSALAARGVGAHVCEVDMGSAVRSTFAELRYVPEGTVTRWTIDF